MRSRNLSAVRLLVLLFSVTLFAAACGGGDDSSSGDDGGSADGSAVSGTVTVSGSSTVEPISSYTKELYNDEVGGDVEISVDGPGTTAGFKEFCAGNTDLNDASRAIKDSEAAACAAAGVEPLELEIAFDGIAIMVHPSNPLECVNVSDLYAISGPESEGNTWEDAAALAAELGSDTTGFPTGDVALIAPGTESGTYGSYVEIVLEKRGEVRAEVGDFEPETDENGDPVFIRTDFAGQPDDNVIIEGIAGTNNAFGWVGFAFAEAAGDSVKILSIRNQVGDCVAPSLESIADGSYPVSRTLLLYVDAAEVATNPALVSFVDYYLGGAYPNNVENAFADGVGYVALPADLKAETDAAWAAAKG